MSRVLVSGGAGFVGSHLCESLLERGEEVVCLDDFSTGTPGNVERLNADQRFTLLVADVSCDVPVDKPMDAVLHLASPASPTAYLEHPLETMAVGSEGTRRLLALATAWGARFVLASTSEVYGDPTVHPQPESYRGNVDPVGPRSVYDEAKRFAEALTMAWARTHGTDVAIARIFNTYGPRLRGGDGRVVSNFVRQALARDPLTVHGDGSQTRSFCYVSDLVRGILALLDSGLSGPVNIGNPDERSVLDLAHLVLEITGSPSEVVFGPLPVDDPVRRCPDISLARRLLGWEPEVMLDEGLRRTVRYFSSTSTDPTRQGGPGP